MAKVGLVHDPLGEHLPNDLKLNAAQNQNVKKKSQIILNPHVVGSSSKHALAGVEKIVRIVPKV